MARIFEVQDANELWWYVADSHDEAAKLWRQDVGATKEPDVVRRCEPGEQITIYGQAKTAQQWVDGAAIGDRIGATLY